MALFQDLNPNSNAPGGDNVDLEYCDSTSPPFSEYNRDIYGLDNFVMFDFMTNTEKEKQKEGCESKCQNQLYFSQNNCSQCKVKKD